jgi:hypothetical protein
MPAWLRLDDRFAQPFVGLVDASLRMGWSRVLELTPEGIHQYGGGYTEYVARTGHEAPGLRS